MNILEYQLEHGSLVSKGKSIFKYKVLRLGANSWELINIYAEKDGKIYYYNKKSKYYDIIKIYISSCFDDVQLFDNWMKKQQD